MSRRVKCPNCGIIHTTEAEASKPGTFASSYRRPYKNDAATLSLPQPQASRETPTGFPSMDTHVRIPFRQTLISGLFDAPIGLAVGLGLGLGVAGMADAASQDTFTLAAYILIIGSGGAIGGAVAFCWTARGEWPKRRSEYDALLWIEEITGLDLNGDGEIGEPQPETVKFELHDQSGRPRLIAEFDTDRERFGELARLILVVSEGFSEKTAKKAGYSRKEWEVKIRDKFIELGAAAWKDKQHHEQGVYLREAGYRILDGLLDSLSTSPLLAENVSKNTPGTNERTQTNELSSRYTPINER